MTSNPAPRSSTPRPLTIAAVAVLVAGGLAGAALAGEVGDVVVDAPVSDDFYGAGPSINVRAEVDGDLTAAARIVTVTGTVTGDVMAIAETVTLAGQLRDDVRVAGRTVTISGEVGDHTIAAGETVLVTRSARIGSFAWLAGRRVQIDGTLAGDLDAAGETVSITGTIDGNARIDATELVIAEGARITGDLSWSSGHAPKIHENAHIGGSRIERPAPDRPDPVAAGLGEVVFGTLALMVLTATLGWLIQPLMRGAAAVALARPGRALGIGLLALLLAPLAGVLALVTVLGAPVGLALLLGYGILLIFSVPAALLAAAELGLRRQGGWTSASSRRRFAALALTSLAFMVALQLPIVGALVGLAAVLLGLGALVLRLRGQRSAALTGA